MSTKNPDQRIGIFIDVQNLYYSARALYGTKVNFGEIVRTATAGRKLVRAIAYAVKAEMPEEQSFFDALEKAGLEVKTKDLQTFVGGQKKADWDVGIAVDILNMAPKLDAIILCSGDGDFQILMHQAKTEGCRAEIVSFGKSTSAKLIDECDDFIDMDNDPNKFLLGYNSQKPNLTNNKQSTANNGNGHEVTKPTNLEDQIISAVNDSNEGTKKKKTFFRK